MSNPFDQFDAAPAAPKSAPAKDANPFDRFDAPQQAQPKAPAPAKRHNMLDDVIKSFKTGALQGATGLAGTISQSRPGAAMLDTAAGMADNVENLINAVVGAPQKKRQPFASANVPGLRTGLTGAPATEDLNRVTQALTGKYHVPLTTPGRYAKSIGQMTPALVAPGSIPARVANTVLPGIASQGAADLAKRFGANQTGQELARAAGGIVGGLAANVRAPRSSDLPPLPEQVLTPEQRNIRTLREAGVPLTPGQKAGGQLKNLEDIASRAPILGAAIKGARSRGVEGLNRAVGHRALQPLGEGMPSTVHTGHDSVAYVAKRLGKAYDDAADMVPQTQLDDGFGAGVSEIRNSLLEQPDTVGRQFDNIVSNRLGHLMDGPVSGKQVREAQSQIGKLAANFSASEDGAQRALGGALDDLQTHLGDVIGRASPEAADLIGRANAGWTIFTRMRNAAAKAKGGVFTPGQLSTAVRNMDKSVGKGRVAKGEAPLQDLSNAAWEVLPDGYGNPGTADALSAFGLAGAMAAPQTAPVAIPAGLGLGAASIPYGMIGRGRTSSLPPIGSISDGRGLERLLQKGRGARVQVPAWLKD